MILALFHRLQRLLVELGVDLFGRDRIFEHAPGFVILRLRMLNHGRIHGAEFVRLALNGRLQVFGRRGDAIERLEMTFRMNALGLRGQAEQSGDGSEALLLGFLAKARYFWCAWLSPAKASFRFS